MTLSRPTLKVIDSITELTRHDEGCVAVSGSHGGRSVSRYALTARPLLSVFNDAGVGKDRAGIAVLDILEAAGLAACTVSHLSACIGQARSTLESGTISHANPLARALGCEPGLSLRAFLQTLCVER
ncbi:hypothetical protein [Hydrogenophaga aquatica]